MENCLLFLQNILLEVEKNESIYNQYLESAEIVKILDVMKTRYIDQTTTAIIIGLLLDFLCFCKRSAGCLPLLITTFTEAYPIELAEKWLRKR